VLPSRAADNLFWLGRYLERAEATLRLIRALGVPTRDPAKGTSTGTSSGPATALPSVERIQRLLVTWGATSQATRANPAKVVAEALQGEDKFGSALSLVRSAQRTAISLRERLSPDAWQVITEMVERLGEAAGGSHLNEPAGAVVDLSATIFEGGDPIGAVRLNMNGGSR